MDVFSCLVRKFKKKERKASTTPPTGDAGCPINDYNDPAVPNSFGSENDADQNSGSPPGSNVHLPSSSNLCPVPGPDTGSLSSLDPVSFPVPISPEASYLQAGKARWREAVRAVRLRAAIKSTEKRFSDEEDALLQDTPSAFGSNTRLVSGPDTEPLSNLDHTKSRRETILSLVDMLLRESSLSQYSLKGAGLHSAKRHPLPRCHPGTRIDLREKIYTWLTDENREQDMLCLLGPAGVGKTAVAQTIGELAEELGIFGAAVFFSRGRKVVDLSHFFATIAYQLGRKNPPYKSLVDDVIQENVAILTSSDKRAQFGKLLVKPFADLRKEKQYSSKVLIIIDGLDECQGDDQQSDLIRLIAEAAKDHAPPFLWMICSRPEHHLKELFRNDGVSDVCLRLDLLPQEEGAQADIERYLTDGLERIAKTHSSSHGSKNKEWPAIKDPEKLGKLVHAASGVFVVASSLLGFIGDPIIADPPSQMQIVLDVIDGISVASGSSNPLAPIDMLYVGVLKEVRDDDRPKTLHLLGACAVAPSIPALHLANLIGMTQDEFYSALRTLHAFLSVPHYTSATQESLHFFHASFPDFLFHSDRSQGYFQDPDLRRLELAETFLRALKSTDIDYSQNLSWLPSDVGQTEGGDEDEAILSELESPLSISYDILSFAAAHTWELCTRISKPREWETLLKMVASFDFRRLQPFCDAVPVRPFIQFIQWLHKLGKEVPELERIVREDCYFDTDEKLLERCASVAKPLDLESTMEAYDLDKSPRYILAGFEMEKVVIIFVPEVVMIYTINDIDCM